MHSLLHHRPTWTIRDSLVSPRATVLQRKPIYPSEPNTMYHGQQSVKPAVNEHITRTI